jgi:micrococcal nuclease
VIKFFHRTIFTKNLSNGKFDFLKLTYFVNFYTIVINYMKITRSKISLIFSCVILLLSIFASAGMIQLFDLNSVSKNVLGAISGNKKNSTGNCKPESLEEVTIVKVVDGDTIEINGGCADKVRLLYIDTPETVKPNTPVQCYGPEASNYSKSRLKQGSKAYLKSDKASSDQYGRSLRILFFKADEVDNFKKSYNYELVAKGYGIAKFYSPNKKYQSEVLQGQELAKANKLGIWQSCK